NPDCCPPWDEGRLRYYAQKCTTEWRHTVSPRQRGRESDKIGAQFRPPPSSDLVTVDPDDPISAFYEPDDYSDKPLKYVCTSLGIAVGKVTYFNGYAAVGKTPGALSYGIHAALGWAWCGHEFAAPVPTLYL